MVARRRAGEDAPPATQDDRTTTVRPGELFACDNTRPYRLIGVDHTHMAVLCVPRASLGRRINSVSRRTAIPLSARIGIGRLVGHALSSATEELADHSPARTHVGDALTALLLAAFADTTPSGPPSAVIWATVFVPMC
ncbi:hypothetical protein QA942_37925 [Streptomyces sp. B21-106]|uniref:AraC-like ligand-binding domain-containing protein n=1 Tax=Streptomyces sp. B21-106 TaxID=3039418 RepID=UPI002FF14CB0